MYFKSYIKYPTFIFMSFGILLFVAGRSRLFRDPGTFFHTALGDLILRSGQLPYTDSYSYTRDGISWISKQWLGEYVMAVVQRFAGLDGLLVVTVSLIALLYSILALRIERSGMNLILGAFILIFSLATASHNLHVRPHMITLFMIAIIYAKLVDFDSRRIPFRKLFWLIPIFILWTNFHGGVLGGLFTLLLVVSGWTLTCFVGGNCPLKGYRDITSLWIFTFLCLLTPLINPYTYELPLAWLKIMGSKVTAELIEEHASIITLLLQGEPTTYITVTLIFFLGLFYFALLIGTKKQDRRVTWYIPIVWFLLALSRIRHAPLFSVLAVIAIADIFPHCNWVRSLGSNGLVTFKIKDSLESNNIFRRRIYALPLLLTALALFYFHGSANLSSTSQKWVRLNPAYWPVDMLPDLRNFEKILPSGTRIFNDMLFGGFLIYHIPSFRVLIDDRCELYGDDFIIRYVKADRNDFDAWATKYQFELALIQAKSNYKRYFDNNPDWCVVKESAAGTLFQRCKGT